MEENELKKLRLKAKKIKQQLTKYEKQIEFFRYCKENLFRLNPFILDVETTGIRKNDEILQIFAIDLKERILFDKLIKPKYINEWEEAYKIHGISNEDVENKKNLSYYRKDINKIFEKHRLLIGYEIYSDINFFIKSEYIPPKIMVLDLAYFVKLLFTNKGISDKYISPSLKDALSYYKYNFNAHNAKDDVYATLYLLKNLLNEPIENFEYKYDKEILKYLEINENINKKSLTKLEILAKEYIEIFESPKNKIFLDIESTGIRENDEIIELSIVDEKRNILFHQYIKPKNVTEWDDAYKIHKISKEDVENEKNIDYYKKEIQKILNNADYIVGYGIDFDYNMLVRMNFDVKHLEKLDISHYFKYLYRKILEDRKKSRPKLIECSSYYGFKSDRFHDSLIDTFACLHSYLGIYKDMKEVIRSEDKNSKKR